MSQKSYDNNKCLYLVPTPIGNLEDITIRSLNVLKSVDLVLCEDTRVTGNLLKKYDIKKKLISCHEYNEKQIKEKVIEKIKEGNNIALVTDQGTPIISDPGYEVVKEAIRQNINVVSLPGATAFVPALTISGIMPSPFTFCGFLNSKDSKRRKELESLKNITSTLIFYEAPHRMEKFLKDILDIFGDREICLCRELSKKYEEIYRGLVSEVLKELDTLKGEFVVVVSGNNNLKDFSSISILEHIKLYLDDGMSEKDAIKKVSEERKVAKSIIYKEYHTREK